MNLILSDKELGSNILPKDCQVIYINNKTIGRYNGNNDVVAIAGSRAIATMCSKMSFPSLKLFQLTSAGFDGVPLEEYKSKSVPVANAGNLYSAPIAETVVFGILQFAKRLRPNPNNRAFKITRGYSHITELYNKKALIMGAGNIGTAVASRLSGFEMTVDGYDPYCKEKPQYGKIIRTKEELCKSIGEYDYIVTTLPDNSETHGFIDNELISHFKKNSVIINVGRRATFDEKALYNALKSKQIGGAVLDMFEVFPNPITNPFRRIKNVIVLPSVAAISIEVKDRLKMHMTENILAAVNGTEIKCVINGVK